MGTPRLGGQCRLEDSPHSIASPVGALLQDLGQENQSMCH